jgi:hypothetical protein
MVDVLLTIMARVGRTDIYHIQLLGGMETWQ